MIAHNRKAPWVALVIGLCLFLAAVDLCAESLNFGGTVSFEHQEMDEFSVDDSAAKQKQQRTGYLRVDLNLRYRWDKVYLNLAGDAHLLNVYGPSNIHGTSIDTSIFNEPRSPSHIWLPREANINLITKIGLWSCGMDTLNWGEGLLIHNGKPDVRFGRNVNTNTLLRCSFATKIGEAFRPFVTGGMVYRDEQAQWREGDRAYNAIAGVVWKQKPLELGILGGYRHQTDRSTERLPTQERTFVRTLIGDVWWKIPLSTDENSLVWKGEMAVLSGHTSRPYLEETFENGADILSGGFVTTLEYDLSDIMVGLEWAYASGDNDPSDDTIRAFSFHSSFGAGLVLVDHVLPMLTARAVDRINDPALLEVTPPSLRYAVNQGTVTGLSYLNPHLSWRINPNLRADMAYRYFETTSDLVDLYHAQLNGGANSNYSGDTPGSRQLGQELNVRLTLSKIARADKNEKAELIAESALFLPGRALQNVIETPIMGHRVVVRYSF